MVRSKSSTYICSYVSSASTSELTTTHIHTRTTGVVPEGVEVEVVGVNFAFASNTTRILPACNVCVFVYVMPAGVVYVRDRITGRSGMG